VGKRMLLSRGKRQLCVRVFCLLFACVFLVQIINNRRERERERERDDDDTGGFSSVLLCSIFQFQNKSAVQISYVSTLAFTLCYVLLLPSLD
jgi:uncharacterized integral membrane protein